MTLRHWILCSAAAGVLGSFAPMQGALAAAGEQARTGEVETIFVTARKRSESIQTAPVAVTAIDESVIQKRFVHDLTDLNHEAPNMQIEGVGAIHRNAAIIFSRGIGYGNVDQGQDPAVAISVDGVFYSRNIGALADMLDIDNVQILRGPQGTLFGKNAVGGVINITTKKASTDDYEGQIFVRGGNLDRFDYGAITNIPIDDTLAVRLAFQSQAETGPFTNVNPAILAWPGPTPRSDKHLGGFDVKTMRGSVHWEPISPLTFDLNYTYIKDRSPSVGGQNGSFGGVPGKLPPDLFFTLGIPGYKTFGGPTSPYIISRDFPSGDFQDSNIIALNGNYHTDDFDIVSVTGWMHDSNLSYNDYDNTALPFLETSYGLHHTQFSEELRAVSNGTGPLKWVAGVYYANNYWDAEQHFDVFGLIPSFLPLPVRQFLAHQEDFAHQYAWTIAGFAQADYHVTDALELSAGVRYTNDDKNISRILQYPKGTPPPAPLVGDHAWGDATYHAGANYQVNDGVMTYFKFDTGFVGGGWNSRSNLASTLGPFAPEKATSYEVGLKGDWFNHTLRADAAAFWVDYSDLQVGVFHAVNAVDGEQQVVANDAFERARGVELEVTGAPTEDLLLSASIGYLDAVYTSFNSDILGITSGPFQGVACNGLRNPPATSVQYASHTSGCYLRPAYTPDWTARFEGSYDIHLGPYGKLTPDVWITFESSHFTDINNSPVGYQPGFALFNASLSYTDPEDRWRVSIWGKNLADERYIVSDVPTASLFTQLYFADPRTFGVELNVKVDSFFRH